MCPQERLFIISTTTGLSFVVKRIGPLAAIIIAPLYLLAFYLFAISNTPENPFASVCSETFIETARQHLLLLVGFDTLIYRKYYDTPPILVGHHRRIRMRSFEKGNLVLKLKQTCHHKLESPWKGPFIITEVIPRGTDRIKEVETGCVEANL